MIDLTRFHNWLAFLGMLIVLGIVLHQIGKRVKPVGTVVAAAFGA